VQDGTTIITPEAIVARHQCRSRHDLGNRRRRSLVDESPKAIKACATGPAKNQRQTTRRSCAGRGWHDRPWARRTRDGDRSRSIQALPKAVWPWVGGRTPTATRLSKISAGEADVGRRWFAAKTDPKTPGPHPRWGYPVVFGVGLSCPARLFCIFVRCAGVLWVLMGIRWLWVDPPLGYMRWVCVCVCCVGVVDPAEAGLSGQQKLPILAGRKHVMALRVPHPRQAAP